MTTAECNQFWTLIVTGSGVLIALFFSIRQSYLMRQQMKVDLFADYTKRYQEIILKLPENINEDGFDLHKMKKNDVKRYNKTMRYMRVYFDLCSEEFFLNKGNKIEKEVWNEWSIGIKYTFTKRAFVDAWKIATKNSKFYDEFAVWINKEVIKKNS